jgi:transposase-like protein
MPKKFSKEQRLAIGQQIYNDEITVNEAASRYDISPYTARDYMRFFRDANHLAPKSSRPWVRKEPPAKKASSFETTMLTLTCHAKNC